MIALAGTVGLILTVVLLTKIGGSRRPLPVAALLAIALVEVALVYFYMASLEVPVP
jgi:hypothetical protein